jgi:hypothetical protein
MLCRLFRRKNYNIHDSLTIFKLRLFCKGRFVLIYLYVFVIYYRAPHVVVVFLSQQIANVSFLQKKLALLKSVV